MNNDLITVSSRLMQNYHVGHPISAGTQIATFKNRAGQVEILSIGGDFNLYNFYPDPSSDTSWGVMKVELPQGVEAKEVVAGSFGDANGPGAIVQTDRSNDDPNFLPIPVIALFREEGPGTPFKVLKIAKGESKINYYPPPPTGTLSLRSHQLVSGNAMLAYTFASPNSATQRLSYQVTFVLDQGKVVGAKAGYYSASWGAKDWTIMNYQYEQGHDPSTLPVTVYASDTDKAVLSIPIYVDNARFFSERLKTPCLKISPTGLDNIVFAISALDNSLIYMRSKGREGFINVPISEKIKVKEIYGTTNLAGRPQVFAIGLDGHLYMAENTSEDETQWTNLNVLENHFAFTSLSVSKAGDGSPIALVVSADDQLFRIYQDPKTTGWKTTLIEFEEKDKTKRRAEKFNSYSTEVTVFDKGGLLRPKAKVKIWSSSNQSLIINGKGHIMNIDTPVEVEANGAGVVTFITKTYDIATSLLHVWTEFMDDDKGIGIQANGYLEDDFATVTEQQLMDAKGSDGDLLKGKFREPTAVDSLAKALNSSMDSLKASSEAYKEVNHGNYCREISGAKCHHAHADSFGKPQYIKFGTTVAPSWQLAFDANGLPVYTAHTSDSAMALIANPNNYLSIDVIFGISIDWGGLWRMIREGVCELVEIIVNPIIDAITTAVHVIIDGVTYIWNGIVTLVEQIFQSVGAFFQRVGVFFEDLVHWLGTVFNWASILRTKEVAKYSIDEMLKFMEQSVVVIKTKYIDDNIAHFKRTLSNNIDAYINTLLPGETIGEMGVKGTSDPNDHVDSKVESNVFTNAYVNNHENVDHPFEPVVSGLEAAIKAAADLSDSFNSSDAFSEALRFFNEIKEKPDQFLQLAMASLLEFMKGIALWALDEVQSFLDHIFDAVAAIIRSIREFIDSPIYIPLVSEIYELVTGEDNLPFSYIDLISIMLAAPATIVYALIKGAPPFKDDNAVNEYKAFFTVEMLQTKSGLIPPGKKIIKPLVDPPPTVGDVFYCFTGVNYIALMFLKPIVDSAAILAEVIGTHELKPGVLKGLSAAECAINLSSLIWSIPWILEPETGAPQCPGVPPDLKSAEYQALIWILEIFGDGIMDAIFVLADPEGEVESVLTSIWGAVQLGMYIKLAVDDPKRKNNIAKALPNLIAIGRPLTVKASGHGADFPVLLAGMALIGIVDFSANLTMAIDSFSQLSKNNDGNKN